MHDLETIDRLNAEAVADELRKRADTNKWHVAKYVGLNFHSIESFDTERERNGAAAAWVEAVSGRRTELIDPAR